MGGFATADLSALARPDIGAYFGSQFTNSSWGLTASGLSPGSYLISVYPHNTSINAATAPSVVWVTVGSGLVAPRSR